MYVFRPFFTVCDLDIFMTFICPDYQNVIEYQKNNSQFYKSANYIFDNNNNLIKIL